MTSSMQSFYRFLSMNGIPPDDLPSFVGDAVFAFITEENVLEILKVLATSRGTANQTFWEKVNSLPTTDEAWASCTFVGGELSESAAEHQKNHDRRVVELVRRATRHLQPAANSLFRRKDD